MTAEANVLTLRMDETRRDRGWSPAPRGWSRRGTPILAGLFTAAALLVNAGPAAGQQGASAGEKALEITAVNLSADDERHRTLASRAGDAGWLLPGDVVRYSLEFTNVKDIPVRNVVIDDPVPEGLRYVEGSASVDHRGVQISYSIDGGRTYSNQPTIRKVVDVEEVELPAPPESYTHIRWTLRDWVQPGERVTAEFRAKLPDPEGRQAEDGESGQHGDVAADGSSRDVAAGSGR